MNFPQPMKQRLLHSALAQMPRPDTLADKLLRDWLAQRGVLLSPADIDVVTFHYQDAEREEGQPWLPPKAKVIQRTSLTDALLANWQGEPSTGSGGLHIGDWAGIAPLHAVTFVDRMRPPPLLSNAMSYLVFNGLYRRTANQELSPATLLPIRAEVFQDYVWGLHLHERLKAQLDSYWQQSRKEYARALEMAFITACNKQVNEGSLSVPAWRLAWQAAGLLPLDTRAITTRLLNVYGYHSTSIIYIKADDSSTVVLYMPGNASPLHEFPDLSALKHWFAEQCKDPERREWLQQCFSPADWEDGLEFSGLITALKGLGCYPAAHTLPDDHPGFATSGTWAPEDTIEFGSPTTSLPITGNLFDHLANRQKQRSYDDLDYRVITNRQVVKTHWGSYLNVAQCLLAPLCVVVPELLAVMVLGGVAQFSLGMDQVINGHSLDEKVEGVENQVFGLFNALPLPIGIARASQAFHYRLPGLLRPSQLADVLGEAANVSVPTDALQLIPAQAAFRETVQIPTGSQRVVVTHVGDDMGHYFEGAFQSSQGFKMQPVVYDLHTDSFIKLSEYKQATPERWKIDTGEPAGLVRVANAQRVVTDAQRMFTLRQLGIELDLPIDYTYFNTLERTPIPRIVSSIWVGDKAISPVFLEALVHNAQALENSDYQYQLFLSRQSPRAYDANLTLLRSRTLHMSVLTLEDQPFYQEFTRSPYFAQYQAALGITNPGITNYSSASDILRYRMLKHIGGFYLDADDRVLNAASGPGTSPLANQTLRTTTNGLLLYPPVSNDQLGFYVKYNNSMIGSHPGNPTLDAISEAILRRFQLDPTFYTERPDRVFNPVGFNAYARRLCRLTGPGVLNDVIDAQLPWLRQLRGMCRLLISPLYDLHGTLDTSQLTQLIREHVPLDRFFEAGRAHSWEHN
ncbi:glycosyltransferase [Pseudomonas juntendi]|uniref:Glycosyltransferase n=1 Tax=Pseudomonas juntendi TaxID=2666183 RepID=A0ABD4YG72_9PSED|nr:DUF6543 domain-containing protein [Pseudomonas juntendi]MDH0758329.1 glycosyltransferase [Pseudomonas juntendi]MDH1921588.1 glycosyltransferase [Pseudomonas juntendi]